MLQRVIDDVSSEAANAAEMKAAASGNPLILMQVQLASDLRKLEALYSQHQRGQHRMRDRLKYLASAESRLDRVEADYAENIRIRDFSTRTVTEKGKEKILVELVHEGKVLGDKDGEKMRDILVGGIKEVTRNSSAKVLFGTYRGFKMTIIRSLGLSSYDGFRIILQGAGDQQFQPDNLRYSFDDKLSLSGLFQRVDNFLGKGLDEAVARQRENARQEIAEMETVKAALGKEFPQQEELALTRENHTAVMRELKRMQDDANYVSTWTPKTSLADGQPTTAEAPQPQENSAAVESPAKQPEEQCHTLKYGEGEGRTEYLVTNQHNGTIRDRYMLHRTYFSEHVGSLGQGMYEDGQWHSTSSAPRGVHLKRFETAEEALGVAREDAARRGLKETPPAEAAAPVSALNGATFRERLARAGFRPTGSDFYGKDEHSRTMDAGDGGIFQMRIFHTADNQTGLRVQYEKFNMIDGSRTVNAQFGTLDEALDFVGGYQAPAECPAAPVPEETLVRGMVFSSRPRMR